MRYFKACTTTLLLFTFPLSSVQSLSPSVHAEAPRPTPSYSDIVCFLDMIESGVLDNLITAPEDLAQIAYFLATLTLAGALPEEEPLLEEDIRILLESVLFNASPIRYFGNWKTVLCKNFISKAWDGIKNYVSKHKVGCLCVGGAVLVGGLIVLTGGSAAPVLSFLGGGAGAIAAKSRSKQAASIPAYEHLRAMDPSVRTEFVHAIRGPRNDLAAIQDPEIIRERASFFAHEGLRAVSGENTLFQQDSAWIHSLSQRFDSLAEGERTAAIVGAHKELDQFLGPVPDSSRTSHFSKPEDRFLPLGLPFKRLRIPLDDLLRPRVPENLPDLPCPPDPFDSAEFVELFYIELPSDRTVYAGKKGLAPAAQALPPIVQHLLNKKRSEGNKEAEPFFGSFFASPLQWHDKTPYDRELLRECIHEAGRAIEEDLCENVSLSFAIKVGEHEHPAISVFFVNGMLTNDIETLEMMLLISKLLGGMKVAGCHNGTGGLVVDGKEGGGGKLRIPLEIDEQTRICILNELERIGPNGTMFVVAHSQGGLIFYQATKSLDKALRHQMDVNTFGTAKVIPRKNYGASENFLADDDEVAKAVNFPYFIDNLLYFMEVFPREDITILEPVEGSTGHSFMSPTYQKPLEGLADRIKKENTRVIEVNNTEKPTMIPIDKSGIEQCAGGGKWNK